ncbi:MAG TPA: HEAT repeat domain-containing protein, partial [Phycisphaerae bacterium]|nr:HEAT repeat domain-containing protein [Phycisphaerae bacterium]
MNLLIRISVVIGLVWSAAAIAPGAEQGDLTPDQAFEQLRRYEDGQDARPLRWIEQFVARATADAAGRLAAVLADPGATLAAKRFACRWLELVGTEAQVPLLVKMLDDMGTADMARTTLEGIPGEASAEALRAALGRLKGPALVGLVNALGNRRDTKAVPALAKLLADAEANLPAAAAVALGKIGTAEAAAALKRADAAMVPAIRDARLRCAERLAAD